MKRKEFCYINLIGVGCKIFVIEFNEQVLEKVNKAVVAIGLPINQAILDIEFYEKLKHDGINSHKDISSYYFSGLICNQLSYLEIKTVNHKKRKISSNEISQQTTLFPLYNTTNSYFKPAKNSLIIMEKETGLISSCKILLESIDLDLLSFELLKTNTEAEELTILSNIFYKDKKLNNIKKDTLITSNYAYLC
jgi:hypothetical protein